MSREEEKEKVKKCQERETESDWKVVETKIGGSRVCTDTVTKEFDGWIQKLWITNNVGVMKKTALLGNAIILRKVLEM